MKQQINNVISSLRTFSTYIVWGLGVGSILGSLYFSEIKNFPPCELCWWTRILIYPYAFIMTYVLLFDKKVKWQGFILTFAIPSLILSTFHTLLQWGIINESVTSCSANSAVSCADPEIMWLGFITIPFLGLITNIAVILITLISDKSSKLSKWLKKILS